MTWRSWRSRARTCCQGHRREGGVLESEEREKDLGRREMGNESRNDDGRLRGRRGDATPTYRCGGSADRVLRQRPVFLGVLKNPFHGIFQDGI